MDNSFFQFPGPGGTAPGASAEQEAGEERWDVYLSDGRAGEMFRRPDGRGGVTVGETTRWGSWADGFLYLDAREEDGSFIRVDRYAGRTTFTAIEGRENPQTALESGKPGVAFIRAALAMLGIDHGHWTDERIEAVVKEIDQKLKLAVRGTPESDHPSSADESA